MRKINTDFKGVVNLQKNYLDTLSRQTNDSELSKKVDELQTQLEAAHTTFQESDIATTNVLTHQDKVKDIVDTEKERLLRKKQSIDNALISKKRVIALNDSHQKKQSEHNKIKFVWVFALAISVLSTILKNHFVFIPSFIFNLVTILVLFTASIFTISTLMEVSRREKTNFDRLDIPDPAARTQQELQAAAAAAKKGEGSDLLGGMNLYGCVGSYCCNPGTKWDRDISKCVHDDEYNPNKITDESTSEQFTTLLNSSEFRRRRINIDKVKSNYANEYDNYSKV